MAFDNVKSDAAIALQNLYGFTKPTLNTRLQRLETGSQRLRRTGLQPSAGSYARIPVDGLDLDTRGRIATYNTTQAKLGGVSPSTNRNGFAYTSTDHSITWYWDGTNGSHILVLHRADRTQFVIPVTGSGLTVSGLTASTNYYFLPFWSPLNTCNVGWVPGTHGTPQIAFVLADTTDPINGPNYVIQQNYQDREPITSSYMLAATAAGGGSGGGGGGGGNCVMAGTDIETLGDLPYTCEVHPESLWVKITVDDGRSLACTVDHPLFDVEYGKVPAQTVKFGDLLVMDTGQARVIGTERITKVCSKWKIMMDHGHLFHANGFLSNNQKPL